MKRYSPEHVDHVVLNFTRSQMARSWHLFGSDIRRAILDSAVMDEIRIADTVDSTIAPKAAELVAFRQAIEDALAAGVKRTRVSGRVSYKVYED